MAKTVLSLLDFAFCPSHGRVSIAGCDTCGIIARLGGELRQLRAEHSKYRAALEFIAKPFGDHVEETANRDLFYEKACEALGIVPE